MSSFFESAPQLSQPLSLGSCHLPIHDRDGGWCGLFYRVPLPAAQSLCTGLDIEPWPIFGAAVAAIYAWEYRDSSVGSYGAVGIGIQVRRRGTRPSVVKLGLDMSANDNQGIWVASLPVTTQAAFDAGVELWNYPKYVTPITTRFDASGAHVRLADELELTLGGSAAFVATCPSDRGEFGVEFSLPSPTQARFRRSLPWPWHQNRVCSSYPQRQSVSEDTSKLSSVEYEIVKSCPISRG